MDNYHEESFGIPKVAVPKIAKSTAPNPLVTPATPAASIGGLRGLLNRDVAIPEPSGALESTTPAQPLVPITPGDVVDPIETIGQITLVFAKSGQNVACDGEESVLEVAESQGIKIRSSCRSGNCGTCKKRKLEGKVRMGDFDPEALEESEQEEGFILTCVSFPQGRVVIDA
jgi:glycine betaine catabolism B